MAMPTHRFPDDVPVLSDGPVTLRALAEPDLESVVEQSVDPLTLRWTTIPEGYDREQARAWLRFNETAWSSGTEHVFAVDAPRSGGPRHGARAYAGTVTLRDAGPGRAIVGYVAHPAARGTGAMHTALGLLLRYGFERLDLQTVLWQSERGNWPSRKLAWRHGFSFDGVVRGWLGAHDGTITDAWTGTLRRDDPPGPRGPWWSLETLRAERVVLRALQERDDPRIVEGCSDPTTVRWLPMLPVPYRPTDAAAFRAAVLDGVAAARSASWAIADASSDALLGTIGIPRQSEAGVEIGYWLHPEARGRGIAVEAVERLVGHAFAPRERGGLGVVRAFVRIQEGNAASLRVAQAAGFAMAGSERASMLGRDGRIADALLLDRVNPLLGV
ncbi:RimJ/RimL family protein N-acetyltransferase [Mumia flava]|uniref:RimJ/RimL family protein N-acetyltransferase n=1 Tax=Mumia flava TaxID=1348852 RepID=A0A0B2BH44_9ACTN|nr:GNAT family N-acetyltransferase [Mumia flava]PJJ56280.1 RimJ/RimL family protein N-acetyltransferase [Mumia flava]